MTGRMPRELSRHFGTDTTKELGARKIFEPKSLESSTSCNQRSLCTKVCLQNARLPSAQILQFWKCAPEEDVLVQDQLDGGEDVEGVVHHQGLSYVPEIIRTELTSRHHDESILPSRRLENSLPGNTMETCSFSRYLLIVAKARAMIRSLPLLTGLQRWYMRASADNDTCTPASRLDCQRPRLSLHLQVLIPLVPLSSSTAVTTYASSIRTSIRIS